MVHWAYTLVIYAYGASIRLVARVNPKARKWIQGRKNWKKNLRSIAAPNRPTAWFHCASLGEFEQGRPVIESFRERYPHWQLVITFFSPSGYEVQHDYAHADHVLYLPLDTPSNSRYFVRVLQPSLVVFVRYEFWLNLQRTLYKADIQTLLISATFRGDQYFFKPWARVFLKSLTWYKWLFVQNKASARVLANNGIEANVRVAGDTRFDRVWEACQRQRPLPLIDTFKGNGKVVIGGSSWEKEEAFLIRLIQEDSSEWKYMLAPHEWDEMKLQRLCDGLGEGVVRHSQCSEEQAREARVLILDGYGYLLHAYRFADIAVVGGGFNGGIHNILEAATYGMPICFGPDHSHFPEAGELINLGVAAEFSDYEGLKKIVRAWQNTDRTSARERAHRYVRNNLGATDRVTQALFEVATSITKT